MREDDHTTGTLATTEERDHARSLALLKAIGLDRVPAEQRELALAIAKRYELDLLLKHLVLVDGRPYITRDGLLHVAHRSGQLDGIEVTDPELVDMPGQGQFWRAKATVHRKDMGHGFTYLGRYPAKGGNQRFAPEMAVKVAEVMALRRAFDVSAPALEERWDVPEAAAPPEPAPPLREQVAARRAEVTTRGEGDADTTPPAASLPRPAGARTDTPDPVPGSTEAGSSAPAPTPAIAEVEPTGPDDPADDASLAAARADGPRPTSKCEGFSPEFGRCVREGGHEANHRAKSGESWKA